MNKDVLAEMRASSGRSYAEAAETSARRFARQAQAAGLVDVAFAEMDSPFGTLLMASTPKGLVRLAYPDEERDDSRESGPEGVAAAASGP